MANPFTVSDFKIPVWLPTQLAMERSKQLHSFTDLTKY